MFSVVPLKQDVYDRSREKSVCGRTQIVPGGQLLVVRVSVKDCLGTGDWPRIIPGFGNGWHFLFLSLCVQRFDGWVRSWKLVPSPTLCMSLVPNVTSCPRPSLWWTWSVSVDFIFILGTCMETPSCSPQPTLSWGFPYSLPVSLPLQYSLQPCRPPSELFLLLWEQQCKVKRMVQMTQIVL